MHCRSLIDFVAGTPCDLNTQCGHEPQGLKGCRRTAPLAPLEGDYATEPSPCLAISVAGKTQEGGVGKPPSLSQTWSGLAGEQEAEQ